MLHLRRLGGRGRSASPRTAPRRPISVERLEDRHLPSGLTFQFLLDDPNHQFDAFPLLRTDLNAAGQILSSSLPGRGTIEVLVRPDDSIPRASGTCIGVTTVGQVGGFAVEENAPVTAARTGVDPNGPGAPEIVINLNAQSYLKNEVWFDPSGAARTGAVPNNKVDFISVALHELLHGCGFTGYRTVGGPNDGLLSGGYESTFDVFTRWGAGGDPGVLYFVGPRAMAVYGGPVPLVSQGPNAPLTSHNYYELGNPTGQPGADLVPDLENGVLFLYGARYTPSPLDLAILQDIGWTAQGVVLPGAAPAPGSDVTGRVTVVLRPVHVRRNHHQERRVLLHNVSGAPIEGPFTLLLLSGGRGVPHAELSAAAAETINVSQLAPGETVSVLVPWPGRPNGHPAIRVLAAGE
jgi:hypothetical protein